MCLGVLRRGRVVAVLRAAFRNLGARHEVGDGRPSLNGVDTAVAWLALAVSVGVAADLAADAVSRPRPHVIAYALGMGMFALATVALAIAVTFGWTEPIYKVFFLFGAVLNIPYLGLGSVYLVAGRGPARFYQAVLAVFTLVSILVVVPATVTSLPESGIPAASETFAAEWLRYLAALGGGVGATLLVVLAVVSIVRFWKADRRLVWANALIVAGVLAASYRGTALALVGEAGGFALALLAAAVLIWAGYRVASGQRRKTQADSA